MNSFSKKFSIYLHSSVPWQQKILTEFLNSIPIRKNWSCLDAGCGIGNNFVTLLKFFNHITACDISREALEYVKRRFKGSNIKLIQADIRNLPFKDNFFDIIICTEVLEHLEDPTRARDELLRVIKKDGGYLIMSVPNYFNFAGIIKLIMDKIIGKESWDVWGDTQKTNKKEKFMTWFKLKKLCLQGNIKIVKEYGGDFLNSWFLFLPFIYRNFQFTDKHPFLWLGKLPIFNYLGMNYFILGETNLSR
jgi:ubiquinone/menaquinone biosynthesis C-methylase UbiE